MNLIFFQDVAKDQHVIPADKINQLEFEEGDTYLYCASGVIQITKDTGIEIVNQLKELK